MKVLHVYQWLKNLLVPLLTAHRFLDLGAALDAGLAFLAFGLCASGVYLLNDMLDLTPDRMHPPKCRRPFAAGTLPLLHGLLVAPLITLAGFALALVCGPAFAGVLVCDYVMTLSYSFKLKRIVMIDVVLLAALYTVCIIGGAVAIHTELSLWLLSFSMFVCLSLAMLKRYTELTSALTNGKEMAIGRGYSVADLPLVQSLGAVAGYSGVFALSGRPPPAATVLTCRASSASCPVAVAWARKRTSR
ncbi:hypothetical protein GCM10027214_07870 [Stenotrophomonas tumulicola]